MTPGFDFDGVVQDFLDVVPGQLVYEAHLVGVHETRIAHHVAAVGKVHREHGAAPVSNGAGPVVVDVFIVVGGNVPAREIPFNPFQKFRVNGHDVFEMAVDRAILEHPDLAVPLDDVRFDLAYLLVEEGLPIFLALDDLLARLLDALGAERIGLARPPQRRLALLPGFQKWLVRPPRSERRVRMELVEKLNRVECHTGYSSDGTVCVFH